MPAGRVIGGNLERSNVDTAEQFVNLIEAQRGFQANSRVITTTDEILAEPLRYAEFQVHLPAGPGLGVALDEDKIAHYTRGRVAPVSIPVKAV